MGKPSSRPPIVFRPRTLVGRADARLDVEWLDDQCFVDQKGYLSALLDTRNPAALVVGRTGSGKSALIHMLKQAGDSKTKVFAFSPADQFLPYFYASDRVRNLVEEGTNTQIFWKYLWRHLLMCEFISLHKSTLQGNWVSEFINRLPEDLRSYLETANTPFFEPLIEKTEHFIQEATSSSDTTLGAGAGGSVTPVASATFKANRDTSKEIRQVTETTVAHRTTRYLSKEVSPQLKKLERICKQHFNDPKKKRYIITVDGLDDEWTYPDLMAPMINALVDACHWFQDFAQLKVVVALRSDLREVAAADSNAGRRIQKDKQTDLELHLSWSRSEIEQVCERRINRLVKQRYSKKATIKLEKLFRSKDSSDLSVRFLALTQNRPRDAITLLNKCFEAITEEVAHIEKHHLDQAEHSFSRGRLHALFEEWEGVMPVLPKLMELLRGIRSPFNVNDLRKKRETWHLQLNATYDPEKDRSNLRETASRFLRNGDEQSFDTFVGSMLHTLYGIGVIGVDRKNQRGRGFTWNGTPDLTINELMSSKGLRVSDAYHRALNVKT